MGKIIYADNAATSFPKPAEVLSAVSDAMLYSGGNPSRGSHIISQRASELIYNCRENIGEFFNCDVENVVLSFNATTALNTAIKGLAKKNTHILISDIEHNAVLRPIVSLCEKYGCTYDVYPTFGGDKNLIIAGIKSRIKDNTSLIIANHASNICSVRLPVEEISALCREKNISFVIDASQSAGQIPIDFKKVGASAICMAGHKGLFGPQGTGIMLVSDSVRMETLIEGGAGHSSVETHMPEAAPERFEAGTYSAPLAAGLSAGVEFIMREGIEKISKKENVLAADFADEIFGCRETVLYDSEHIGKSPIVLFNIIGKTPAEVSRYIDSENICTRSGLHCAPLAHKTIAEEGYGAVRVSFGYFNTGKDVKKIASVVRKIAENSRF